MIRLIIYKRMERTSVIAGCLANNVLFTVRYFTNEQLEIIISKWNADIETPAFFFCIESLKGRSM